MCSTQDNRACLISLLCGLQGLKYLLLSQPSLHQLSSLLFQQSRDALQGSLEGFGSRSEVTDDDAQ